MHATMRHYAAIDDRAFDRLLRRRPEVEALIRQTPGFAQYHLIRTNGGMTSVTVCADEAGCEDANRRVAAWIRENMSGLLPPPQVTGGEAVIHLTAG